MRANEAPRGLLDRVGAVVDDDRLKQHAAVAREEVRAAREERVEIAPADRLDHLDRDELLVAPAQIAIVLAQHGDSIGDPRRPHVGWAYSYCSREIVVVVIATAPRSRGVHGKATHPVPISST